MAKFKHTAKRTRTLRMVYSRECVVEWTHNGHAMIRRPEGRRDWVPVEHLEPWHGQLELDFNAEA